MEKIIVFGTGGLLDALYDSIKCCYEIILFLDNNKEKQGVCFDGIEVVAPDNSILDMKNRILISSYYIEEIREQLLHLGVDEGRIFCIDNDILLLEVIVGAMSNNSSVIRAKQEIAAWKTELCHHKILFIVDALVIGGAEKSLLNFLEMIGHLKNDILLLVINGGGVLTQEIPTNVKVVEIYRVNQDKILQPYIFKYLTSEVLYSTYIDETFDTVIAYAGAFSTKLAAGSNAWEKVAWVHSDLSVAHPTRICFKSVSEEVDCYNKFLHLAFVSHAAKNGFEKIFYGVKAKKHIVNNIFDIEKIKSKSQEFNISADICLYKINALRFLYVGRLSEEKGVLRLLMSFNKLLSIHKDIHLTIIGAGPLEFEMRKQISRMHMDDNVLIIGECGNPYPYMKWADVMILPSFYEGQPLVVGEAFSLGLPVIATDSSACREMLNDGKFGLLVSNSEEGIFSGLLQARAQQDFINVYKNKSEDGVYSIDKNRAIESLSFLSFM